MAINWRVYCVTFICRHTTAAKLFGRRLLLWARVFGQLRMQCDAYLYGFATHSVRPKLVFGDLSTLPKINRIITQPAIHHTSGLGPLVSQQRHSGFNKHRTQKQRMLYVSHFRAV